MRNFALIDINDLHVVIVAVFMLLWALKSLHKFRRLLSTATFLSSF